ncbi:PAS domain S-box protein [Oxynema aestuarii]|jgi:PAS domain S-box-containing protein|uniref:histidine kinase n=1 Tax=Oxynema aestuarii AP17 TaxID=2064643 RepID=A0A6H1TXN8_9CYAN|nr:PAS domain S-box protein [Oxynema aestuarii]QIZ70119.1 PAS domain S-box protein [Oxynema aestuarii AP17]RMH72698.1 MAG: PAS domain S-box protein [Cyanobacteria bacterium J007]
MAKILIVDDDLTVQLVLRDLLESEGHQVSVALNGQEGLQRARAEHPDLMICDWMMPVLDGLQVCRQVKADPQLATMFFILLTAREEVDDRVKGLDTGADDFLSKPVEAEELLARVRAALRLHHLTRELSQANQQLATLVEVQRRLLAFQGDRPARDLERSPYPEVLEPLGKAAGATRVYLFQIPSPSTGDVRAGTRSENCPPLEDRAVCLADWSASETDASGATSSRICDRQWRDRLIQFPPRWLHHLTRGETVAGISRDFPEGERQMLEAAGVRSILMLPLIVNGEFFGFVGFDNAREARPWSESEVSLLKAAAAAISLHQERIGAEAALRKSEARYRAIVEDQTELICRFAPNGRLTFVNDAYCRYFNVEREQLMDGSLVPLIPHEPLDVGETPAVSREHRIVMPDGTIRTQQWTERAIFDERGRLSEFQAVGRDITERKQAEAALRSSEERFRQLAENIEAVFWIGDRHGRELLYVSPAYEQIWGLTCEDLYRNPAARFEAVHPEERDRLWAALHPLDCLDLEYRIVRPDGSIRWIRDRGFPIRDESGEIYRVAGIAEDITERKHAEEQLRQAIAKEREVMELKTRFISMVSHEFRTPLTTILSSADLLEFYIEESAVDRLEKKRQALNRIQNSAVNMTQLLEDVLFIGRSEANGISFQPQSLDLETFCQNLIEELHLVNTQDRKIQFFQNDRRLGPDSPPPRLDSKLLRQILSNLLSNALKYSPPGGRVEFTVDYYDRQIAFTVKDSGIGIKSEDLPRLFELFHRCSNVGDIPGTGLGLAIVKRSVDLHGGEITVDTQVGVGTTFKVTLPLSALPPVPLQQ